MQDHTIEELDKEANRSWFIYWGYVIASLVIAVVGGLTVNDIIGEMLSITTDNGMKLLLIFGSMSILNFFLLLFIWLTNESSYYKMLQLFHENMRYQREKEIREKIK